MALSEGWTQAEAAGLVGCARTTVGHWAAGHASRKEPAYLPYDGKRGLAARLPAGERAEDLASEGGVSAAAVRGWARRLAEEHLLLRRGGLLGPRPLRGAQAARPRLLRGLGRGLRPQARVVRPALGPRGAPARPRGGLARPVAAGRRLGEGGEARRARGGAGPPAPRPRRPGPTAPTPARRACAAPRTSCSSTRGATCTTSRRPGPAR